MGSTLSKVAKEQFVPTLSDAAVKTVCAAVSAVTVNNVLRIGSWIGRTIIAPTPAPANVIQNQALENIETVQTAVKTTSETVSTVVQSNSEALVAFVSGEAECVKNILFSPTFIGTIGSALADTIIEKGCDAITHFSKKKISKYIREPLKVSAAAAIYYAAGSAAIPAGASYLTYRVVNLYAKKMLESYYPLPCCKCQSQASKTK